MGYAVYETPMGWFRIDYTDKTVRRIDRVEETGDRGTPTPLSDQAFRELRAYMAGDLKVFTFPHAGEGTPFQKQVWQALSDIPYGEVRSYKEIAEAIGKPGAARAVGGANRVNPLSIVVPCHRVINAGGGIGGYAGGLDMKRALLALEAKHR